MPANDRLTDPPRNSSADKPSRRAARDSLGLGGAIVGGGASLVAASNISDGAPPALAAFVWATTILIVTANVLAPHLTRLYWSSLYARLIRKGIELASTTDEVRGLMTSLTESSQDFGPVPQPPPHPLGAPNAGEDL